MEKPQKDDLNLADFQETADLEEPTIDSIKESSPGPKESPRLRLIKLLEKKQTEISGKATRIKTDVKDLHEATKDYNKIIVQKNIREGKLSTIDWLRDCLIEARHALDNADTTASGIIDIVTTADIIIDQLKEMEDQESPGS